MEIKFNVTKEARKNLVKAVGEITGWKPVYKGVPSFAYAVNNYIIDKNGALIYDDRTDANDVQHLLTELSARGFTHDGSVDLTAPAEKLVIEVSPDGFTDTALQNLGRHSRYHFCNLHSFFTGNHTIELRGFNSELHAGKVRSYVVLALALNNQALTQKSASARKPQADNEKFAMRTYLNRIGLIGDEFRNCREHLCKHLDGCAAWRLGSREATPRRDSETAAVRV